MINQPQKLAARMHPIMYLILSKLPRPAIHSHYKIALLQTIHLAFLYSRDEASIQLSMGA